MRLLFTLLISILSIDFVSPLSNEPPIPFAGEKNVSILPFRLIFPHFQRTQLYELTNALNLDKNHGNWNNTLEKWVEKYWVNPSNETNETTPKFITDVSNTEYFYLRGANKTCSLAQGREFLKHREGVNVYIRYMYRATQILQLLNETEAATMRDVFWDSDDVCHNLFTCTQHFFYQKMPFLFGNGTAEDVKQLSSGMMNFRNYGDVLYWKLPKP